MTLPADRLVRTDEERRGRSSGPRRSWASAQPFEPRPTPFNSSVARSLRWAEVSTGYQWRAVALDALAVVAVGLLLVVPVYGANLVTAGRVTVALLGFLALVAMFRGYDARTLGDGSTEVSALLRAGFVGATALMALSYTTKAEVSRLVVFAGIPTIVLLALAGRYLQRQFLHRHRARGVAMMRTLVVGDPAAVARVVGDLVRDPSHGFQVAGVCLPSVDDAPPVPGVPVVGAVADVPQVVADRAIETVVVAGSHMSGEALRRMSWALARAGAQLVVAPDLVEVTGPRLNLRPTAGLVLLEVQTGAPPSRMLAKAALDRGLGTCLLLLAAPVIGAAALAVRATSPGPAFYRQTRVGVDGRTFTLWKLRSMYLDADARRDAYLALTDRDGPMFKMRRDPRVTPVGRFLRRYSIDELPQLWNVVTGDMSLVGPRPPLESEVATYADHVHRRLHVRPGLTGLWQVSGRADLSWEESVRLDLRYVDNWSLAMDLLILWKTFRAVVGGSGAY
ncbi:polyprenyl glycosylphosphotransferase [Actinotalea fermentans ATCC 43279 = JCM 9966 = DSM 3133]|uniref:Exopolysaccharide biosynthesis polyprenyl glycosylphosphotransferase n=1 Tax=Actinotalea fermentans TaxID=43671 RepID=A0A511YX24_9CELL|nr:polyprenyl glycosylphosphotransferase [Actinotalea fermentans ATCC 43279 = JCM 9966 = DSM 3133]GEN79729.1 exopolysaccharide biosynthesis polyprenyl glycosylphosphotransferase [Actinotalea fermentans]